jgi:hydroxymethylpyrimidine pyrophosphatase-like HAD family hydrolase
LSALRSDDVLVILNTGKTEIETRNVLKSINFTTLFIVEIGAKFCDIYYISRFIGEIALLAEARSGFYAFEL